MAQLHPVHRGAAHEHGQLHGRREHKADGTERGAGARRGDGAGASQGQRDALRLRGGEVYPVGGPASGQPPGRLRAHPRRAEEQQHPTR